MKRTKIGLPMLRRALRRCEVAWMSFGLSCGTYNNPIQAQTSAGAAVAVIGHSYEACCDLAMTKGGPMSSPSANAVHPDIKPENAPELASRYLDVPNMPWQETSF